MKQWIFKKIFPEYWETIQKLKKDTQNLKDLNDQLINQNNNQATIIMKQKQELKKSTFKWS